MPYTWPRTRGETVCAIHVRSTFAFKPIFNLPENTRSEIYQDTVYSAIPEMFGLQN